MSRHILTIAVATLLVALVDAQDGSDVGIMTFEAYARVSHSVPYVVEVNPDHGGLLYFGAEHTSDPARPQFSQLETLWNGFHADVAFVEGRDPENPNPLRPASTMEEAVRTGGEAGLTIFLSARDQVPARTLEPARREEVALLLKDYTPEQIKLFYVLRQVSEFNRYSQNQPIERLVGTVLGGLSLRAGLETSPRSLTEFEAAVGRLLPELKNWRDVPVEWFDPVPQPPLTYLNAVSRVLNNFRDRHMVDLLLEELRQGKRVFAVVGASHVVMQEPALKASLKRR